MTPAVPLAASYDLTVVLVSVLIATLASYVTLDLAKRVRTTDRRAARHWWIGGSLAMGSGIWAMHYLGMAAIDVAPGIDWNPRWVAASALIAVAASGAALTIFLWLREASGHRSPWYQLLAAVVMGLAISGMHYSGMAAASFPADAVCLSADSLSGGNLGALVTMAAVLLLSVTLWTSILDARTQGKTALLAGSLQQANAQLQVANAELQRRAFLDPLTGLPNRLLFEDRLAHAIARHGRTGERIATRQPLKIAVLFVDLDGFKGVNDSLGHAAGDAVLKEAALRLRSVARDTDTVARVGGDEFLVLMEDVSAAADAIDLSRRLLQALAKPFERTGQPVLISASVGIVLHPGHGHHDKLIANADAAMYAAKRAGGNTYVVFESRMDAGSSDQFNLQHDLRRALELGQMQLHYQPKIDGRRGQIIGVEALLRWNHPTRGMVGPYEFIPIAERFGLIGALGAWVIDEACRQIQAWADEGVRMRVAINISVHQLREEDLVERIRAALERHCVEPSQLLCEITESVAMEDLKATQRAFEGLAQLGVFLSIDDFGTGYSSLSYLRQLPARQLKIDRSFVNDLETSSDARAVVDAVVRLAHALGLKVVAEGVETDGQRLALLALGCDELQGYFFARPMSAATLLGWTQGVKPADAVDFSPSMLLGEAA